MNYADHFKGKELTYKGDTLFYTGKWYREDGLTWFEVKGNNKLLYINQPPK